MNNLEKHHDLHVSLTTGTCFSINMTFGTPQKLKSSRVLRFVGHVRLHSPLTVSLGEAFEEEGAEYMRSLPISVTQHIQEEIPKK